MKKKNLVVRIVAIVLVALMVLSVGSVLFQTVFAADGSIPVTGSEPTSKLPIFILIGAVVLIAICVILPMLKKKN